MLVNSFLLFRELRCSSHRMKYFSVVQRLHFVLEFEYGLARATISHVMVNSMLFSFRRQICVRVNKLMPAHQCIPVKTRMKPSL